MIAAPWTVIRDTPNKSPRQNVERLGVVLHHGALTSLTTLRNLTMGGKQVSATAIVKDDIAELLVADAFRPWSLSSAYWDSALRSIECANESTTGWTISAKSHETIARCVAYWADTDGFWPHRDGDPGTWTVLGHREVFTVHGASYATECPGGMNLNGVTRRAQELLNGDDDMPRYLEWSDEDKNWLAWDVLNKPVIENAFGHTVSIAAIVNGIEKRLANQTPTQTVASVDAGQVAAALAADPGFVQAIAQATAKAVNDDAATRLAQ